jgi:hypothetical protein
MKRLLVLVLLVPILALTMISCDADMRSNIAGLMGGFGGNVYEDAGLIVVNTAQAEAAAATVATIGTGAGAATITGSASSTMGLPVTDLTETKLLEPQSKTKQTELKNNLGDALNSETQKKKLLEDLKKPASGEQKAAAKGTIEVFNKTLKELESKLTNSTDLGDTFKKLELPDVGDNPTQGDMLALQLMTDLISNTIATLNDIGGGGALDLSRVNATELEKPANKTKVLSIIDDALFAADMAEQLSGAASIDFTGQIDLGDLLDGLDNKGSQSREISLTDAGDFIETINSLAPSIVGLMGVTNDGTTFTYSDVKYKSFLLNQQIYRSSMEQALKMLSLGKLKIAVIDSLTFDTSTLIKYTLSVLITEHEAFVKSGVGGSSSTAAVIQAYLNANTKLGFGTLTENDSLTDVVSLVDYEKWPTFIKGSGIRAGGDEGLTYFKAILQNIVKINDLGGIAQLSTELNDFLTDTTDDGFDKTYAELME